MKKILTLVFCLALTMQAAFAQCTINTGNTTDGFTPSTLPCITPGTAYGQAVQVHIPSSGTFSGTSVTIDSVRLLSTTGMPAGIAVSGNPLSGTIRGGGNGCLWFSGTTNVAGNGSYPLANNVRIWAKYMGFALPPVDTSLASLGYTLTLTTCAVVTTPCTINTSNTTNGFTPASLPCITRSVAYGQQDQIHIPATAQYQTITLNIDSVKLLSVTGMPTGIAVSGNPASGVIRGGGNGCLWYSGTTTATAGNYPLTFNVRVWASYMGIAQSFDTTVAALGYNFSLSVCPAATTVTASITPAGPDSICTGDSVTLTANAGTGYTYKWNNAARSATQSISVSAAGSYRVTVYSGTDSAVSSPVTVVLRPLPVNTLTLTGSASLCPGDSVIISASAGFAYTWNTTATTRAIIVKTGGSYTVTVTDSHGCKTSSSQTTQLGTAPTAAITQTTGYVLTSSAVAASYQWYRNDTIIPNATAQSYTATQNGTYTLKVTSAGGCSATSSAVTITMPVTGINDISILDLNVYPNPGKGIFTITAAGAAGSSYAVSDLTGRVVATGDMLADKQLADLSFLAANNYVLTIGHTAGRSVRFTIVK